ncbi:MAG: endonuclease MutS2 [Dethiosulfovibrio peptidovorans]|nr:MAG: endonuclease MutS2 [Dethiosulfovibrio peptidovorans]
MRISKSVLSLLEIETILNRFLASGVRSSLGDVVLRRQSPCSDREQVLRRQALFEEYRRYLSIYGSLPWMSDVAPLNGLLDDAQETGLLSGEELLRFRTVLSLGGRIREAVESVQDDFPFLLPLSRKVRDFSDDLEALSVLDENGVLYDGASPKLREIREKLNDVRRRVRREVNSLLHSGAVHMLQERVLSIRNGRSVVLVRQEFVGRFPGILVDRSSSGNSVYMEPNAIIPLNNKVVALRQDERDEERRIFRELTARFVSRKGAVLDAQEVVGTVDMCYSVSELMDRERWIFPEMTSGSSFRFFGLRHPLLGSSVVPIDVHCGGSFRVLVVTGPNTGGKTVALKTVGVAVVLAWCGFPVPGIEGSQLGDISGLYADIGDEQSIEQSLSTFSAHLTNVIQILNSCDDRSLILLDELGAGTDPQEGAALGVALLKVLLRRGPLVLATTHHNPIKKFATTTQGVETASMDFDVEKLLPTYRLVMGVPGQSNALAIAQRLGIQKEVALEAQKALQSGEASVEAMIGELQRKNAALEAQETALRAERVEIERLKVSLKEQRRRLEKIKRRTMMKADQEAERILEQAERQAKEMLRGLETAAQSAAHRALDQHKKKIARTKERSRVRQATMEAQEVRDDRPRGFQVGDVVQVSGASSAGEILALEEKKAQVLVGGLRVEVPLNKLTLSDKRPRQEVSGPSIAVARPVGVPSSIMVRGMTVDEAMPLVADYLDRAVRAGYGEVTVIHGRGEGILRRKVHKLCSCLQYVSSFRLGENGEGGYGVTIVSFR